MQTNVHRPAQRGITLIELLVVVAIVSILATVAVANYRSQSIRANRAEGKTALLRIQAQQEKYYLSMNQYTNNLVQLNVPAATERGLYNLQIELRDAGQAYTARATATGSQTGDKECPVFSIDDAGLKLPAGVTRCWQ